MKGVALIEETNARGTVKVSSLCTVNSVDLIEETNIRVTVE